MWPGGAFNFVAKDTVGLSGGLIIIWDADELDAILSFSGTAFIGVCVKKKNSADVYFLVNAYSPCIWDRKKEFWRDLLLCKRCFGGGGGFMVCGG